MSSTSLRTATALVLAAHAQLAPTAFADALPCDAKPAQIVSTTTEPIAEGPFKPTWESLAAYEVPEWFRDARFGIRAHWGPQCAPEANDWYARDIYLEGHWQYKSHLEHYGHPSESGFKDVIHAWKTEKWEPEKLVAFYKRVGARYFFAMAIRLLGGDEKSEWSQSGEALTLAAPCLAPNEIATVFKITLRD